jgi:hypothetical protein
LWLFKYGNYKLPCKNEKTKLFVCISPHRTDEKYGEIKCEEAGRSGKEEEYLVKFSKKLAVLQSLDDNVDTNKDRNGTRIYTFQPMRVQYELKQRKPLFDEKCPKL